MSSGKDFLICDMHVHTKYSCDSEAELEAYCLEAVKKGIAVISFTEHIDYNINDYGYGYYDAKSFFNGFMYVKEKYHDKLNLLCGLEFSEPHLYQDKLLEYSNLPYDYMLGSVHYWYKGMFPSRMVKEKIPAEVCYEYYWNEVLVAVKTGGFDVLAHIDFPKRYYGKLIIDTDKIQQICKELVQNNICLEINTSTLRQNLTESMPDKEILSIYKSLGGRHITVGSDAHEVGELSADYAYAKKLTEYFGFEEIIYKNRKKYALSSL